MLSGHTIIRLESKVTIEQCLNYKFNFIVVLCDPQNRHSSQPQAIGAFQEHRQAENFIKRLCAANSYSPDIYSIHPII